jgi:hypothetical protein
MLTRKQWILLHSINATGGLILTVWGISINQIIGVAFSAFGFGVGAAMVGMNLFLYWMEQSQ